MSDKDFKLIKNIQNEIGNPAYDINAAQVEQVKISADEKMNPGIFKPDPKKPGCFIAHPLTIEAMKKDIFLSGDSVDEVVSPYTCEGCKFELDRQFWLKCPSCGSAFKL